MASLRRTTRLALLCLAWSLGLGYGPAHAATLSFSGGAVEDCKLSGKTYTCSKIVMQGWNDNIVIADGYTVNVKSTVSLGYNHGLTMSGTARLTSTGDINVGGIAPGNFKVSGGSFEAAGSFTVGNQNQTMTADVSAGSLVLGNGSSLQITGKMISRGTVAIGSHVTINGPVSGTTITTNTPVVLNGKIDASVKFTLSSGSRVTGNVTAPVVDLLASGSVVTGDIKATTSLTLASGTAVDGNVDTGTLTLDSAEAIIRGSATVDLATLNWHGRVTEYIQCRSASKANACSCVKNNSGYDFNTPLGPKCGASMKATGIHHFLVSHDGSAAACVPETVTITACSDASCSTRHAGGATVTAQPGGSEVKIGSSGAIEAEVTSNSAGAVNLYLETSEPTTAGSTCWNSATKAASCTMQFSGGISLEVGVPNHRAGETVSFDVSAKEPDGSSGGKSCKAAFINQTKEIRFACSYVNPSTGGSGLALGPELSAYGATQQLACGGAIKVTSRFDANGTAKFKLSYPDVGKLNLDASADAKIKGAASFTVAPHHFALSATPSFRSGLAFDVHLEARNKQRAVTPNFDSTKLGGVSATTVTVKHDCVRGGFAGGLSPADASSFTEGKGKASPRFDEAGYMDAQALLEDFLGSEVDTGGTSNTDAGGCAGSFGPFVPMYYQVELAHAVRAKANYFYSGETIRLKLTAMNASGQPTTNYPKAYGAGQTISLSAHDASGGALAAAVGELTTEAIVSDSFASGSALVDTGYRFEVYPTKPTLVRLRADNKHANAAESITSADGAAYAAAAPEKARPEIRSGRLRIANRFGYVRNPLKVPVTAEYWTGKSWLPNNLDNYTEIPASAVARTAHAPAGSNAGAPTLAALTAPLKLSAGAAELAVASTVPGWIDIAINLGKDAGKDGSCLPETAKPQTTGAKLPWLRVAGACSDPSGRATFGIFPPENRRIIHQREVFN